VSLGRRNLPGDDGVSFEADVQAEVSLDGERYLLCTPVSAPSLVVVAHESGPELAIVDDDDVTRAVLMTVVQRRLASQPLEVELEGGNTETVYQRASTSFGGRDYTLVAESLADDSALLLLGRDEGGGAYAIVTDPSIHQAFGDQMEEVQRRTQSMFSDLTGAVGRAWDKESDSPEMRPDGKDPRELQNEVKLALADLRQAQADLPAWGGDIPMARDLGEMIDQLDMGLELLRKPADSEED
jgi:hypothetical protein